MILAQTIAPLIKSIPVRHRIAAAAIALPCFGVIAAFGIVPETHLEPLPINNVIERIDLPVLTLADSSNPTFMHEERIQRGDTVASLLARLQVEDPAALSSLRNSKHGPRLNPLVPGRTVRAVTDADGKLASLQYLNGGELLSFEPTNEGYTLRQEPAQLERRLLMKSATIKSSLFGATDAAGLADAVATQIADIFSTDIDFHKDLRQGDSFSVVYEVFYHLGEVVRTGRVMAAEFINQGKIYQAVYFSAGDAQGGYYTLDGKNLRKQFLRSPLEFSRITSGFTLARFHPLLQLWRAHKGIDYGAPAGTPVKATADGVVDFAGRQGAYGNLIVLRHQSKYTTWYGHLLRFASGMQKGRHVAQGDVIAFVGATGLATGPHLHYEFRVDNVHENPLRVAMPEALPITSELRPKFVQAANTFAQWLGLMRGTTYARLD